jgi:hypothetical protein
MSAAIGPGARVLCIEDNWILAGAAVAGPKAGSVYTVKAVHERRNDRDGPFFLELFEWTKPGVQRAWLMSRFRPLDEPNIEALRALIVDPVDPDTVATK